MLKPGQLPEAPLEPLLRRGAAGRARPRPGPRRRRTRSSRTSTGRPRRRSPAPCYRWDPADARRRERADGIVPIGEPSRRDAATRRRRRPERGRARRGRRAAAGRPAGDARLLARRREDRGGVRRTRPGTRRSTTAPATGSAGRSPRASRSCTSGGSITRSRCCGHRVELGEIEAVLREATRRRRGDRGRLADDRLAAPAASRSSSPTRTPTSRRCARRWRSACPITWCRAASSCSRSCR